MMRDAAPCLGPMPLPHCPPNTMDTSVGHRPQVALFRSVHPALSTHSGSCSGCGTCMSRYYCKVCHLFDDDPGKAIYHCPFCNFCRQVRGAGAVSGLKWIQGAMGEGCCMGSCVRSATPAGATSLHPGADLNHPSLLVRCSPNRPRLRMDPRPLSPCLPPTGQGPGHRLLPLHVLQRMHEPGAVQQARVQGAEPEAGLPSMLRHAVRIQAPRQGGFVW